MTEKYLNFNYCIKCGKPLNSSAYNNHHLIPVSLNPVHNVVVPMHNECHEELNNLYVNQQKKPSLSFERALRGIIMSLIQITRSFERKLKTELERIDDAIYNEQRRFKDIRNGKKLSEQKDSNK